MEGKPDPVAAALAEVTCAYVELQAKYKRLEHEFASWRVWVQQQSAAPEAPQVVLVDVPKLTDEQMKEIAKQVVPAKDKPPKPFKPPEPPLDPQDSKYDGFHACGHVLALGFEGCRNCKMSYNAWEGFQVQCRSNPGAPPDGLPAPKIPAGHNVCLACGTAKAGRWMEQNGGIQTGYCLKCVGKLALVRTKQPDPVPIVASDEPEYSEAEFIRGCERCGKRVDIRKVPYYAGACRGCWRDEEAKPFSKGLRDSLKHAQYNVEF